MSFAGGLGVHFERRRPGALDPPTEALRTATQRMSARRAEQGATACQGEPKTPPAQPKTPQTLSKALYRGIKNKWPITPELQTRSLQAFPESAGAPAVRV